MEIYLHFLLIADSFPRKSLSCYCALKKTFENFENVYLFNEQLLDIVEASKPKFKYPYVIMINCWFN